MKQITLNIRENKFKFFMELLKSLDFVQIAESVDGDSKESVIENLKSGFAEIEQFKKGKLKTTSAKAFLNEL